jgi:hypothetical protein
MRSMKFYTFGILSSLLAFHLSCLAEVEEIIIKWTPGICLETCTQSLEQQYNKVKGVTTVSVNQTAGQANLTWQPNIPFSYMQLYYATKMIGVSIHDFRVTVRGTITHDDRSVILTSIGDGTQFHLLGPIVPSIHNQVIEDNIQNHTLSPNRRDQFINAQSNNQIVTVSGPIFEGWRSPPIYLVVEQVSVKNPNAQ